MSATTLNLHSLQQSKTCHNFDRASYSKTLQAMKVAHFKTYFETQNSVKESANGISLPRLFKSFHPCPFKLIIIDLCKKQLKMNEIPEIFQVLSETYICKLQSQYQKLDAKSRQEIINCLVEDVESDLPFFSELDICLEKLEDLHSFRLLSSLLNVFKNQVTDTKKHFDFLKELTDLRGTEARATADLLMLRKLSSALQSGDLTATSLSEKHQLKLNELSEIYSTINIGERFFLEKEFSCGRLGYKHYPKAEKVMSGLEGIIREIKLDVKGLTYSVGIRNPSS